MVTVDIKKKKKLRESILSIIINVNELSLLKEGFTIWAAKEKYNTIPYVRVTPKLNSSKGG